MVGTNAVIGMVSKYDGFLGRLTRQMFEDKPEILSTSDKEFKASDILSINFANSFLNCVLVYCVFSLLIMFLFCIPPSHTPLALPIFSWHFYNGLSAI